MSQAKFLLDKYIAGLCFYRTAFPIQKFGLKSSIFRSKSFPRISSKSYRHNAVPNHFSSRFSTSLTNASRLLSRVKMGTHSPLLKESHTAPYTPKHGCITLAVTWRISLLSHLDREKPEKADARHRRVSASSGTAAPLGCVILLEFCRNSLFTSRAQSFLRV